MSLLGNTLVYLKYEDVFDNSPFTRSEVEEVFKKYDKQKLLDLLCKINLCLWKDKIDGELQFFLMNRAFSAETADKVARVAAGNNGIVFHRHQILNAIKLVHSLEDCGDLVSITFNWLPRLDSNRIKQLIKLLKPCPKLLYQDLP